MTYDDEYQDAMERTFSRKVAERLIRHHSADWNEFVADCGDHATYTGRTVFAWLGY